MDSDWSRPSVEYTYRRGSRTRLVRGEHRGGGVKSGTRMSGPSRRARWVLRGLASKASGCESSMKRERDGEGRYKYAAVVARSPARWLRAPVRHGCELSPGRRQPAVREEERVLVARRSSR
jgi:hypothetical protein